MLSPERATERVGEEAPVAVGESRPLVNRLQEMERRVIERLETTMNNEGMLSREERLLAA